MEKTHFKNEGLTSLIHEKKNWKKKLGKHQKKNFKLRFFHTKNLV